MGQYKVPQDVEAEDKLLGPLSLRQLIYVVIAILWAALMWRILIFNVVVTVAAILPVSGLFLLLGFGRRQEQSFENYFIAYVQFLFVPRTRVWSKDLSQDELIKQSEVVTEIFLDKSVSRGSLRQLSLIMDTHGAQKDPTVQLPDNTNEAALYGQRIIDPSMVAMKIGDQQGNPQMTTQEDVLDGSNTHNKEVNQMLENVEADIHQQALQNVQSGLGQGPVRQNISQNTTQPQTPSVIIKKAMLQSGNLTVQQIAKQASGNILQEGQPATIN